MIKYYILFSSFKKYKIVYSSNCTTVLFKKNTPKKILKLYEKNYDLIPFLAHKEYKIER